MQFGDYLTGHNVLAIVVIVIGIIWLIYGIVYNRRINNVTRWPKTSAVVLNSVIETPDKRYLTVSDLSNLTINQQYATIYSPRVLYQYTVMGTNYQSTNVYYGRSLRFNAFDIRAVMQTLAPGTTINISYNPHQYSESYIYVGERRYGHIFWGIILILAGAGIFAYQNFRKKGNGEKKGEEKKGEEKKGEEKKGEEKKGEVKREEIVETSLGISPPSETNSKPDIPLTNRLRFNYSFW